MFDYFPPPANPSSPAVGDMTMSTEPGSPSTDTMKMLKETQPSQDRNKQANKPKNGVSNKQDDSQPDTDRPWTIQPSSSGGKGRRMSVTFGLDVNLLNHPQHPTNLEVCKIEEEEEDDKHKKNHQQRETNVYFRDGFKSK